MRVDVDFSGITELQRRLRNLQREAKNLDGRHEVPFDELFSAAFMRRYTTFASIDDMLEQSEWTVESAEDFYAIPDGPWDSYVAKTTQFENWVDMYETAGHEWMEKKVKKALDL